MEKCIINLGKFKKKLIQAVLTAEESLPEHSMSYGTNTIQDKNVKLK